MFRGLVGPETLLHLAYACTFKAQAAAKSFKTAT